MLSVGGEAILQGSYNLAVTTGQFNRSQNLHGENGADFVLYTSLGIRFGASAGSNRSIE